MEPDISVLFYAIVETVRFPCLCEKNKRDRLSKIIELQSRRADGVDYRCIVNYSRGDVQCART